jgi:hypothetical protein
MWENFPGHIGDMKNDVYQHPKRDPRNAAGPFYALKGYCLACGLPEEIGRDLMADLVGGENLDSYFVKEPTTAEEVERACRVLKCCCVDAFRYGGKDKGIIASLGNSPKVCDFVLDEGGQLVFSNYVHPNDA